jgi:hypothetical protein
MLLRHSFIIIYTITTFIHYHIHDSIHSNGSLYVQLVSFYHCRHSTCIRTRITVYEFIHGVFPLLKVPLLANISTYLAPSSCDWSRPPRSQDACKLLPLSPIAPFVPSPPKSQPFLDFPGPNVHLIRAHLNPLSSIQNNNKLC